MFAARLRNLLLYYLRSRGVDTFEDLCSLLVADKLKSSLYGGPINYVLSLEGRSGLPQRRWPPFQIFTSIPDQIRRLNGLTLLQPRHLQDHGWYRSIMQRIIVVVITLITLHLQDVAMIARL